MLELLQITFSPGDGSANVVRGGAAANVSLAPFVHSYPTPGTYTQTLTVQYVADGESWRSISKTVTILVTAPVLPPAEASVPTFTLTGRAAGSGFGFT